MGPTITLKKDSIVYFGDFDMDDATSKNLFQEAIEEIPNSGKVHVLMECATPKCQVGTNCFGHINKNQYKLNIRTIKQAKPQANFIFYVTHRKPSFNTSHIKNVSIPEDLTLEVPVVQIKREPAFELTGGWSFNKTTKTVTTQKFKIDSLERIFALLVKIPPLINLAYRRKKVIIRIDGVEEKFKEVIRKWCNGKYWPTADKICVHENITVKIGEISYSTGSTKAGFGLTKKLHPEFRQFILKF